MLFPRLDDHGSKAKDIGLIFMSLSLRLKSIIKQAHERPRCILVGKQLVSRPSVRIRGCLPIHGQTGRFAVWANGKNIQDS